MAMFAAVAALAGMQLYAGMQSQKDSNYNAELYNKQAEAVDVQKRIEAGQYDRAKNKSKSTVTARTAGSGLELSGSPMAVMIDNLTQLEMDKQVGQYNLEIQKRQALSTSEAYKTQGKRSMFNAGINAFSTLLVGGMDYASRATMSNPFTVKTNLPYAGNKGGIPTYAQRL